LSHSLKEKPVIDVLEMARRALDSLDVGVAILSPDLEIVFYQSAVSEALAGAPLAPQVREAIEGFVISRRSTGTPPPAVRVEVADRALYLRVVPHAGPPPLEIAMIHEEVVRDVDLFRLLHERHGVSRREYQILTCLRLGKTNRQIAIELGVAASTVATYVHKLLARFDAPNRTRLADLVEQIARRRR